MGTLPAAKVERWQRFRDNRNKALAARHGWLTLTSFQWLENSPAAVELAPGLQPAADIIVLKSHGEADAYLQRLNHLLLGLGLMAILAGASLIFLISDTVTRPLASLVKGVHALARRGPGGCAGRSR